jgi:hypothetical protein
MAYVYIKRLKVLIDFKNVTLFCEKLLIGFWLKNLNFLTFTVHDLNLALGTIYIWVTFVEKTNSPNSTHPSLQSICCNSGPNFGYT